MRNHHPPRSSALGLLPLLARAFRLRLSARPAAPNLRVEALEDRCLPSAVAHVGARASKPHAVVPPAPATSHAAAHPPALPAGAHRVSPTYVLSGRGGAARPLDGPGPSGYGPGDLAAYYGFDQISFGGVAGDGTGQTIAIVDAGDDPTALGDLQGFDAYFGLPDPPSFTELNQDGGTTLPPPVSGWALEIALDVEWAHGMAPGAKIVLVEANSSNFDDMDIAVTTAASLPGVSAVSMSWGSDEFSDEATLDSTYTTPAGHAGVTFVAASGDGGAPPLYPSSSPNVLSVGGTQLLLGGDSPGESGWIGSGGGISAYEPQPAYQKGVVTQSSTMRTTPDVASHADSNPGVSVRLDGSWWQVGGTSASAPQWAALIAIANQGRAKAGLGALDGPGQTMSKLYALPASDFHDIVTGGSLGNPNYLCGPGYDLVTGLGTPVANLLAPHLTSVVKLTAVPDQTVLAGQSLNVSLSATDSAGLSLTYGGTALNLAYALKLQYGWFFSGNDYFNSGGKQEKWFQGAGGAWFFILPSGALYKWDGTINQATGTLIATFDATYYADPSKLYNAQQGSPPADIFVSGNVLTITPKAGFVGVFVVEATAGNGTSSDTTFFKVTVT
jgi:hypothetical protein